MFKWLKLQKDKPVELPIVPQDPQTYIKFIIGKNGEFDIELMLLSLDGDERSRQVLNFTNFVKQFFTPELYSMLRLALDKCSAVNPNLLIDTRAISNIIGEFQQSSLEPCIRPSEVFRIRNNDE